MIQTTASPENQQQSQAWLRGLLAIAWADGDFDERERRAIAEITHNNPELARLDAQKETISPEELAQSLGDDPQVGENFLRTAVMVAIADGVYTLGEDQLLQEFCQALGNCPDALQNLRHTLEDLEEGQDRVTLPSPEITQYQFQKEKHKRDVLAPVRQWLDHVEVHDPNVARFLCRLIPANCPFEREITLFGKKLVRIPPMCELNPLYEQLVALRFRALSYLADDCGEDVSRYF
ncbi:TerB family tellurite resistance protein [Phormidium yuhuli AB48]|uniref:TerB family tellurite resistance protein n=1 Tax=Phormidium yuhuli AB48 TaxID=2940671 RepID=A0ABY5AR71_9CYAN|nr:Mo-dependent nitrogenase C-terminal domain-containing protein [Phormidium yuhuli]USR91725.1 TerB family tellurite resistance protein [Phormidium yuhuli AB48]